MPTRAEPSADAKSQIANLIDVLSESWNRHDMATYAAQFTEDADFVNVIGMHWRGRPEIEARHADVHGTIFRNSTLRTFDNSLRLLGPGIVLAHIKWEMTGHESPQGSRFRKSGTASLQASWLNTEDIGSSPRFTTLTSSRCRCLPERSSGKTAFLGTRLGVSGMGLRSGKLPFLGSDDEFLDHMSSKAPAAPTSRTTLRVPSSTAVRCLALRQLGSGAQNENVCRPVRSHFD